MKKHVEQHKALGFWTLTALVAGNIIGSGVFLLPASLGRFGTIGIVAWMITSIGAILLALVFSRLSRMLPKIGGPYAYCREAYGDFVGFQIAYNYWVALWIGNAAIAVAFVGYAAYFFPFLSHSVFAGLATSIGLVWLLTFINILGVRQAGIVQLVTTIFKLIPLCLIAAIGMFFIHPHYLHSFNVTGHSNISALTGAATLTLWSFIGFESATVPAGDVINPKKNIPRATIFGTVLAAIIYVIGTTSVMGMIPMKVLADSSSPYAAAAQIMFGHWGGALIAFVAMVACFGTLNGWVLLQGQVPLAAAEDDLFPEIFTKLSKTGTPVMGLVVSSCLMTALLLFRYGGSLINEFTFIIMLAVLASLIPYLYTTFAEVVLLLKGHERFDRARLIKSSMLAFFAFLYAFWAIMGEGSHLVYYGLLLFLTSVPLYAWMKWRKSGEFLAHSQGGK